MTATRSTSTSRIEVTELPDADDLAAPGIFPSLFDVYYRQGYEAGYERALNDILARFLESTEEFIADRDDPREARRLLHAFASHLEGSLRRRSPANGYVEGGLGI